MLTMDHLRAASLAEWVQSPIRCPGKCQVSNMIEKSGRYYYFEIFFLEILAS